ncbi:MAG: FkbM family methyltransferase [Saprospiraceae bacterium]
MIRKVLKKLSIINSQFLKNVQIHFSQEGEDIILQRFFKYDYKGFYLDVGAHQPYRFSNTHFFYQKGWRGINIEPNPENFALFRKYRNHDINVNVGVSKTEDTLDYFMLNESALNTFSKKNLEYSTKLNQYKLIKTIQIPTLTLESILDKYLINSKKIDFMSVDVEGFDLDVLESNNWNKYRPTFVLVESHDLKLESLENSDIHKFMKSVNYKLVIKTFYTCFYQSE